MKNLFKAILKVLAFTIEATLHTINKVNPFNTGGTGQPKTYKTIYRKYWNKEKEQEEVIEEVQEVKEEVNVKQVQVLDNTSELNAKLLTMKSANPEPIQTEVKHQVKTQLKLAP